MTTETQDLVAATQELHPGTGVTLVNNGSEIRIDDTTNPVDGYRVLTAQEETAVRTRANQISVTRNQSAFIDAVKQEVQKRVFAIASSNTQMNMTAARADGALTADQESTYYDGRLWIASMQTRAGELIADGDTNYTEDSKWPDCPQNVIDLANLF